MIAVSSSGKSFRALAAYLARGRGGDEPDRVAWSTSRNLPTGDPELAAVFMRATAGQSDRVEKPVYHIALSFDPGDQVDRATMELVASKVIDRLGLSEHQAVIVAHGDRGHAHVHILVNRVHPETGKAWERWQDQPAIQQVLREEERRLGLREVVPSLSPRELGAQEPATRVALLVQMLKTYERIIELARARDAAQLAASAARIRSTDMAAAVDRARNAEVAFRQSLTAVYRDPGQARQAFGKHVEQHSLEAAAATLRERPEQFGQLVTTERSRAFGLVRTADDQQARHLARSAAVKGRQAIEAQRVERGLASGRGGAEVDTATGRATQLNAEIERMPRRRQLEHQIGTAMGRLLPKELDRLRLLVTAPQLAIAQRLRGAVRDVVLGREEERG
jgi:hypothetical protein